MIRALVLFMLVLPGPIGPVSLAAQDRDFQRENLRNQVVERFVENYRSQAGLTDQQYVQFRDVARRGFEARNALNRRERAVWQALEGQMRPGVAAERDSVGVLLDALVDLQAERVAYLRAEQEEFATFLSAVQRAQLTLSLRRLQNQIERVLQQRMPARDRPRRP